MHRVDLIEFSFKFSIETFAPNSLDLLTNITVLLIRYEPIEEDDRSNSKARSARLYIPSIT